MNQQPIEKQDLSKGSELAVHSIFRTIQGEGPFAGRPAVFIRLAGCNLQCPGCDTDYTGTREYLSPDDIINQVQAIGSPHDLIVITGGEPFRQDISALVYMLARYPHERQVQIETNGTLAIPDFPYHLCTVVCAPKTGKIAKGLEKHIEALKYVVTAGNVSPDDGLPIHVLSHPAHPVVARPPATFVGLVYVQPADDADPVKNAANLAAAVKSCLRHGYTLCLQIHKIINME